MLHKRSEKGQAIIIIVFSIIGIIGLTALTVDGGLAYSDRRSAQGAADSAAWAAGLANARNSKDPETAAEIDARKAAVIAAAYDIAERNRYPNDDYDNDADPSNATRTDVYVNVVSLPMAPDPLILPDGTSITNPCPLGATPNVEITVEITSYVKTFFAPVIGVEKVTNHVTAVTRACGTYRPPIFNGQAVVSCGNSLNAQNPCGFDSGDSSSSDWTITGSGLHSDTCVHIKEADSVSLEDGQCLDAVTGTTGAASSLACPQAGAASCTDDYLASVMPPNPCGVGGEGLPQSDGVVTTTTGKNGKTIVAFGDGLTPKVYCITDANALGGKDIVLDNATLYFTESKFNLKFAGGGGFSGTPSASGTYSSLAIVVAPSDTPCPGTSGTGANDAQQLEYRGNGSGTLFGTILAPTACVDMRGNAGASGDDNPLVTNGQIIANSVTSNGNASITVNYVQDQNYQPPEDPTIILVK